MATRLEFLQRQPTDPLAFIVNTLLLACWIQARKVTKVDPMAALRYE
jgi:ABC-type lipoprotein release transport system permease subunit